MRRSLFGSSHPEIAVGLSILGTILHNRDRYVAADSAFWAARAMVRTLGREHEPSRVKTLSQHGRLLRDRGEYTEAVAAFEKALKLARSMQGFDPSEKTNIRSELASIYEAWGKAGGGGAVS